MASHCSSLGATVLLVASLVACTQSTLQRPRPAKHLAIITIDTLRADHLGAYGSREVRTPRLDAIAAAGAMAPQATAHVPLTLPSHVSLFSGRLPLITGIRDNIAAEQIPQVPLLAERLKEAGFRTGAFVSAFVLTSATGLDRGFDVYSDDFAPSAGAPQFLNTVQRRGDITTDAAIGWLEQTRRSAPDARVFLWLHLFDPHDPYAAPEPYASQYAASPYAGEVAWSDELVGRLDDALERLGLKNETLLVVTSDHGEGLGEHGETLHGFFVYESTLRVPMLARGPGIIPGTRLPVVAAIVDVVPTTLDLLGLPATDTATFDGRNLASAVRGEQQLDEAGAYAETLVPRLQFGWSDLRALREGQWKYIRAPRPELYDVVSDPGELNNLIDAHPSRAKAMRGAIDTMVRDEQTPPDVAGRTIAPEALEKLAALGYVGGGSLVETSTGGADPKDMVDDFRISNDLIRRGLLRLHDGEYAASVVEFRKVLARGVQSFEVHLFLARGLLALGNAREAARHFEEAARRAPVRVEAWEGLAESHVLADDLSAALHAVKKGQEQRPEAASLRVHEARILRRMGRRPEALHAYAAAATSAPRSAQVRLEFGELRRDVGRRDEAIERLREAVSLDPQSAAAWNSLAAVLGAAGRTSEAAAAFEEAIRRDPRNHLFAYNLGYLLLQDGRPAEARTWLEKSMALDPTFAPARQRLKEIRRSRGR
jgi:arylsulfatase A-like enzyme/Flp pilus assembly protein TadD